MLKIRFNIADHYQKVQQESGAKLRPNLISVLGFPLENLFQTSCAALPLCLSLRWGLTLFYNGLRSADRRSFENKIFITVQ